MKSNNYPYKRNSSQNKRYSFLQNVYGKDSTLKFRKLFVSRVNPKDKKLQKTEQSQSPKLSSLNNSLLASQKSFHNMNNQQKQETKDIKQFVKDINTNKNILKLQNQNKQPVYNDFRNQSRLQNGHASERDIKSSIGNQQDINELNIEKINQQADQIIKHKLNRVIVNCRNHQRNKTQQGFRYQDQHIFKRNFSIKRSKINDIPPQNQLNSQSKLDQLVNQVRGMKQYGKTDQDIQLTDKKISIIQKFIAEKNTQSEVAKQYYFQYLTDKKQTFKKLYQKSAQLQVPLLRSASKSVNTQSINKSSYKCPKKQDYDLYRYRPEPFKRNLQPFPRSTYHRQFIGYKDLPNTNFSCKSVQRNVNGSYDNRQRKSTYSQDFHQMHADKINIKELDSYKDKFKQLDISFIKLQEKSKTQNKLEAIIKKNKIKQKEAKIPEKINHQIMKSLLTSQNKRQFKGVISKSSIIKHKYLSNLKYSFKKLIYT